MIHVKAVSAVIRIQKTLPPAKPTVAGANNTTAREANLETESSNNTTASESKGEGYFYIGVPPI